MKKLILSICFLTFTTVYSQISFVGTTTSSRVGFLNSTLNPAELSNLSNNVDVHLLGINAFVGNNKLSASDFLKSNLEQKLVDEPGDFSANIGLIAQGPGVAFRVKKWGFAVSARTEANLIVSDINRDFAKAIIDNNLLMASTAINSNTNQRINGVVWGEVAASAATALINNDNHSLSVGVTGKLLFPGTYANMGVQTFQGSINTIGTENYLSNANASVNFAYSGALANDFGEFDNISKSFFGGLNGLGVDLGASYTYKKNSFDFFKIGLSIRNIGSMTIKNDNTRNFNYQFSSGTPGLGLNQFSDVTSLSKIEQILLNSGNLSNNQNQNELTINLPTTINMYASIYGLGIFELDFLMQQRVNNNSDNYQINTPNYYALIPRLDLGFINLFVPASFNDYNNFNAGFGLNIGGFYLGSNSLLTNVLGDGKDGDLYLGIQFGF